ncbi:hypothetical protein OAB88_00275 [Winogradskyella sp.]|nr:hypothetical protein [Winogradskyella sp.]
MKKLLILPFIFPILAFSQYSSYYDVNINSKSNINANVNVSGNITKKITTIDYGELAKANALRERNRLENLKFQNEREKEALLAIAENPERAFEYGKDNSYKMSAKQKKALGLEKRYMVYHKIPHSSLFVPIRTHDFGYAYPYQNISEEGVTTQMIILIPISSEIMEEIFSGFTIKGVEESLKYNDFKVGELNDLGNGSVFLHKKDLNKTNVNGSEGFVGTLIWEDDYEICITDNYVAEKNGIYYRAKVIFKGDKDDISFEELEGRRYYFNRLIKKMILTAGLR